MTGDAGPASRTTGADADFDGYAGRYDEALQAGLSATGEDRHYYARGRAAWVARRFAALGHRAGRLLDFGCGTGASTPWLLEPLGSASVLGVDVSPASLEVARREHASARAGFARVDEVRPAAEFDSAFCNGVFHHIPPEQRAEAVAYVHRALRPGGLFAFWENNPWNPGTRYVMSRVEFDRDAVTLTPPEAKSLLSRGGFEIVRTDFLFVFPRVLRALRPLEPRLASLPLGGQYLVLCRRPAPSPARP